MTFMGEMDQNTGERAMAAILASISTNLTSKTYTKGLSDFMGAIASDDAWKTQRMIEGVAGSFAPTLTDDINEAFLDQTLRESQSVVDAILKKVPGASERVEPRRNMLGQKVIKAPGMFDSTINPFASTDQSPSVMRTMAEWGDAVSMPDERRMGLNLRDRNRYSARADAAPGGQSPYDRMLEAMNDPEALRKFAQMTGLDEAPPTLEAVLTELVEEGTYRGEPVDFGEGRTFGDLSAGTEERPGGAKFKVVNAVAKQYQQIGWAIVSGGGDPAKAEYPQLAKDVRKEQVAEKGALLGMEAEAAADSFGIDLMQ